MSEPIGGRVKWYSSEKRWGFIRADDGTELFVHENYVLSDDAIATGMRVTFEIAQGEKGGRVAVNVRPAQGSQKLQGSYAAE